MVQRKEYLNKLIVWREKQIIKVVTVAVVIFRIP